MRLDPANRPEFDRMRARLREEAFEQAPQQNVVADRQGGARGAGAGLPRPVGNGQRNMGSGEPGTKLSFLTKLQYWSELGDLKEWNTQWTSNCYTQGKNGESSEAVERIKQFLNTKGATTLDLSSLGLRDLPPLPSKLKELNVSNNRLTYGLSCLPQGLLSLKVSYNGLRSLPDLPAGLTSLDASNNQICCLGKNEQYKSGLPSLPQKLLLLNLSNNCLRGLPRLPDGLTSLDLSNNELYKDGLPELPKRLLSFKVSHNSLRSLPALPDGLTSIDASDNYLASLPTLLPPGLTNLKVINNNLGDLPVLPATLKELEADYNQLTTLRALPPALTVLGVSGNELAHLPNLPHALRMLAACGNKHATHWMYRSPGVAEFQFATGIYNPIRGSYLTSLDVRGSGLTELPNLPTTLRALFASDNKLAGLPDLPKTLSTLFASNNKLIRLPRLPDGLETLHVARNQLTQLPSLPEGLKELSVNANPALKIPADIFAAGDERSQGFLTAVRRWQKLDAPQARRPESSAVQPTPSFGDALRGVGATAYNGAPFLTSEAVIRLPNAFSGGRRPALGGTSGDAPLTRPSAAPEPASVASESASSGAGPSTSAGHGARPIWDNAVLPLSASERAEARRLQAQHDVRQAAAAAENEPSAPSMTPELFMPGAPPSPAPLASTRPRGTAGWTSEGIRQAAGAAPGNAAFLEFLNRLRGSGGSMPPAEYKNEIARPTFLSRVDALLDAMEISPALRNICLSIATDATTSCGDRIGLALNDMEMARINDDALQGRQGLDDEVTLFKLGRGMCRISVLEQIITETILRREATGESIDSVEIRLAYQTQLAEQLDLPGLSRAMLHFSEARLTSHDIDNAARAVGRKEAETGGLKFLAEWQPWQKAMQRRNPAAFARVEQSIQDQEEAVAVLPESLTGEAQRTLYADVADRKLREIQGFTRTQTIIFMNENQHRL